ncbi:MAG: hypothetical protein AAF483_15610 [Planctomycetota bacterium]
MPIEFACDTCSRQLRVPDGTEGSQCECPACKTILLIPEKPQEVVVVEEVDTRLKIPCPGCGFVLMAKPELLGTTGQCRKCKSIFTISENPQPSEQQVTKYTFSCPSCKQLFEGKEEMEGRKGRCHSCGEVFRIELKEEEQEEMVLDFAEESIVPNSAPAPEPTFTAPSDIQISCSSCSGVLEVPASAAGQQTACPYCQQILQVPAAAQSPVQQPTSFPIADVPQVVAAEEEPLTLELVEESAPAQAQAPASPAPVSAPTITHAPDIQLSCSSCQGIMQVPASAAGQQTSCPFCQQLLLIPGAPASNGHQPATNQGPMPSSSLSEDNLFGLD